ncbi:hypothetical protein E8E13_006585 [Curvularia kusanoi]|uniref:Uncharacterized protein n=1 Tax=Curvularia kusanoi TaxID=90978 RepID=A0A9P4W8A3_CURKU|nr:hypothetical protein E8E13_006585 [Curvularia kusanoi]
MFDTCLIIAKHLRARTSRLPLQEVMAFKYPNFHAIRRRTVEWEPILPFTHSKNDITDQSLDDNSKRQTLVVTYSTFDPGASRLLLLSSTLPMSGPSSQRRGSVTSTFQQMSGVGGTESHRPWPYSLPVLLQPRPGTTYDSVCATQNGVDVVRNGKAGFFQKVLYGNPDPDGNVDCEKGL